MKTTAPHNLELIPEVHKTVIDGITEGYYIVFRQGYVAKRTLEIEPREDDLRFMVDIADDGLPIALEIIGRPKESSGRCTRRNEDAHPALLFLFTFATSLVKISEASETGRDPEQVKLEIRALLDQLIDSAVDKVFDDTDAVASNATREEGLEACAG